MGKPKGRRPAKRADLLRECRHKMAAGKLLDTDYTKLEHRPEQDITLQDVRQVIESGFHEASRDRYSEGYGSWSYAIRGKTKDGRELRVVVFFDEEDRVAIAT